ncbi:MAG: caspase family protein, partial [Deltaproteobacteria bacterium]
SLMLAITACVSDKSYNRAILKLEGAWKEVNDRTLESDGHRFFEATKQQGFMAAQLAASRLGMVVEQQSYETGFLFFTGPAPVPLTMSEWKLVQDSDTKEMRSIIAKDVGIVSWWVTLDPSSKEVLANIFVIEKGEGIQVSVGLRLRSKGAASGKKRRLQPPPTAVRLGLSKFWTTFEQELSSIVKEYSTFGPKPAASPSAQKRATAPKPAIATGALSPGNPDAVAVIIGNKKYGDRLPPVDFAHNDAEAMKRFVVEILGINERNVIYMRDVTLAEMEAVFGNARTHRGKLWRWVRPRDSDVYVYYSGHGTPGLKDGREYLLPVDGDPDSAEIRGYPAQLLYKNLAKLEARSVTVFLDACFSGETPRGTLVRHASAIRVVPKEQPKVEFTVVTAARKDQVASWDKEAQHGLFTKHLLDALYGGADGKRYGNADSRITLSEIKVYLDREMTYAARRHYGREQQAMVTGDPAKVIVILGR